MFTGSGDTCHGTTRVPQLRNGKSLLPVSLADGATSPVLLPDRDRERTVRKARESLKTAFGFVEGDWKMELSDE